MWQEHLWRGVNKASAIKNRIIRFSQSTEPGSGKVRRCWMSTAQENLRHRLTIKKLLVHKQTWQSKQQTLAIISRMSSSTFLWSEMTWLSTTRLSSWSSCTVWAMGLSRCSTGNEQPCARVELAVSVSSTTFSSSVLILFRYFWSWNRSNKNWSRRQCGKLNSWFTKSTMLTT